MLKQEAELRDCQGIGIEFLKVLHGSVSMAVIGRLAHAISADCIGGSYTDKAEILVWNQGFTPVEKEGFKAIARQAAERVGCTCGIGSNSDDVVNIVLHKDDMRFEVCARLKPTYMQQRLLYERSFNYIFWGGVRPACYRTGQGNDICVYNNELALAILYCDLARGYDDKNEKERKIWEICTRLLSRDGSMVDFNQVFAMVKILSTDSLRVVPKLKEASDMPIKWCWSIIRPYGAFDLLSGRDAREIFKESIKYLSDAARLQYRENVGSCLWDKTQMYQKYTMKRSDTK